MIVAVVLGLLLSRTVYGQQLYTIGSNPVAARFSGIRAKRNTTVSYVITGLCVGLAAVLMMANVKSSNPQASNGKEMEIILAVVLGGVSVTGFAMAVFMSNAGGAWDNAKKYIERGNHGGKGSEQHKAAVVGDTVGDPFKDTSGPSLNILIKLVSTVSIVFSGLIVTFNLLGLL